MLIGEMRMPRRLRFAISPPQPPRQVANQSSLEFGSQGRVRPEEAFSVLARSACEGLYRKYIALGASTSQPREPWSWTSLIPSPTPHLPKGGKTECFQNVQRLLNICRSLIYKTCEAKDAHQGDYRPCLGRLLMITQNFNNQVLWKKYMCRRS